jgi:hypothetical protein
MSILSYNVSITLDFLDLSQNLSNFELWHTVHHCCNYPCAGPAPLGIAVAVAIGIAGATQLECASVEATHLGMGIGSAPEGANLGTSAEAPESGNGPTGIKTLYIAL